MDRYIVYGNKSFSKLENGLWCLHSDVKALEEKVSSLQSDKEKLREIALAAIKHGQRDYNDPTFIKLLGEANEV